MHKISSALDKELPTDIIYVDYSKTFDSVDHKLLLKKLHIPGISGSLLEWMTDYLLHRRQKTTIQGSQSCSVSVPSGVPRGFSIGLLLFLLYVNDLPSVVNSRNTELAMFADDTKCFSIIKDPNILSWSTQWYLDFNIEKREQLEITRKKCITILLHFG